MLVMDCTLRDGANVVGKGFDARLTKMMIEGKRFREIHLTGQNDSIPWWAAPRR